MAFEFIVEIGYKLRTHVGVLFLFIRLREFLFFFSTRTIVGIELENNFVVARTWARAAVKCRRRRSKVKPFGLN